MRYLTEEELFRAIHHPKERTPEQLERARLLGEKMKSLSYEERRAIRMKLDEEDGHC